MAGKIHFAALIKGSVKPQWDAFPSQAHDDLEVLEILTVTPVTPALLYLLKVFKSDTFLLSSDMQIFECSEYSRGG